MGEEYAEEQPFDLMRVVDVLRRRWLAMILIATPMVVAALFYPSTRPSIY